MATAALAYIKPIYYLISGVITTILFICAFVPLVEIMRLGRQCVICNDITCPKLGDDGYELWELKHKYISYEIFWGCSMTCFILAAYQIGSAIVMVYEENATKEPQQQRTDTERNLTENVVTEEKHDDVTGGKNIIKGDDLIKSKNKLPGNVDLDNDDATNNFLKPTPIKSNELTVNKGEKSSPAVSVIVAKGQVNVPEESPVPEDGNNEFTLNDF